MNLFKIILKCSEEIPSKKAFISENSTITYQQLSSLLCSNYKLIHQMRWDDKRVLLHFNTQEEYYIAFLSLVCCGCWVIPISMDTPEYIIKNIMESYEVDLILHANQFTIYDPTLRTRADLNIKAGGIYHSTSGSTGIPKLCVRSIKSLMYEGENYTKILGISTDTRILSLSPIYHSFTLGAGMMAALMGRTTLYVMEKFNPRKALYLIDKFHPNIILAVPVMLKLMTKIDFVKEPDTAALQIVLTGAGLVTPELNRDFKQRFGIHISSNYGSTETGGVITKLGETPESSVGIAMPGVEIKLVNSKGLPVQSSEEGEALIRCDYMLSEYVGNDEIFDDEGYFNTGDIMTKNDDGYYFIVGRKKNMINVGGNKVNPIDVESILLKHPDIKDCYVYGSKEIDKEVVNAFIVAEDMNEEKIRGYLRKHIRDYMIPSVIHFANEISRNSVGKVILPTQ